MIGATAISLAGAAAREDRDRPRRSTQHDVARDRRGGGGLRRARARAAGARARDRPLQRAAGERFLGDLRVAAYDKLQELSMPFFEETRAGVLVSRLTTDVQTLTTFTRTVLVEVVGSVLLFVVTLVILIVALAAALARDARLGAGARLVVAALRQALAAGVPRAARPRRRHDVVAAGRAHRRARRAVVRPRGGALRDVPRALARAGVGVAAHLARQHRLLPGDRVRAVARARRRARRGRLPAPARHASRSARSSRSRST